MSKNKKKHVNSKLILWLFVLLIVAGGIYLYYYNDNLKKELVAEKKLQEELKLQQQKEAELKKKYNECLQFTLEDDAGVLELENDYLEKINSKYSISFMFEDLNSGYKFAKNEKISYYAASTIKLLDALYIYTKARAGSLNLDDTKIYTSEYDVGGLKNYKIGDKISIRNLVKEAILVSDNNAHFMLVDYIGFNNLKSFGNDLGATTTLIGGDNFGNMNAYDANLYLKELYNFLSIDDVYSKELYDFFLNADQNYFNASDVDVLHKYGNYSYYYNDLSIVYEDNPYSLAILSYYGEGNYEDIFADIQLIINNFSKDYNQYKVNYCTNMIYEKTES